jgi:hypothetical protein
VSSRHSARRLMTGRSAAEAACPPVRHSLAGTKRRAMAGLVVGLLMGTQPLPLRLISPVAAPKVGIVGDSITASAVDQLRSAFAGSRLSISAVSGIGMQPGFGLDLVKTMLASKPDVLVVELGINNVTGQWDLGDFKDMESILAAVASVRDVLWVVPGTKSATYFNGTSGTTLQHRILLFRNALISQTAKHPNVRVANFGPVELRNPDELLAADGLHLTVLGRAAFAEFVFGLAG